MDYIIYAISEDLKWGKHTDNISDNSNKTLGVLQRNLKYGHPPTPKRASLYVICSFYHGILCQNMGSLLTQGHRQTPQEGSKVYSK